MAQLRRASMMLLTTLEDTFLAGGAPDAPDLPDERTKERCRRRYFAALRRLRRAGIQTVADEHVGAEAYVSLRTRWDGLITRLAPAMAYNMEEIDPAGSHPETAAEPRGPSARPHPVGH